MQKNIISLCLAAVAPFITHGRTFNIYTTAYAKKASLYGAGELYNTNDRYVFNTKLQPCLEVMAAYSLTPGWNCRPA